MDLGNPPGHLWLDRNHFPGNELADGIDIVGNVLRNRRGDGHGSRRPFKRRRCFLLAAGQKGQNAGDDKHRYGNGNPFPRIFDAARFQHLRNEALRHRPGTMLFLPLGGQSLFMPLSQSSADVIGVKTEGVANRNERENLIRFVAKNPFPGFIKKNLLLLVLREDVVLKTPNTIVQHRQQQSLFRFQRNFSAKILAELFGQQYVGLKKGRDSFVAARAHLHGYILGSFLFEFHVPCLLIIVDWLSPESTSTAWHFCSAPNPIMVSTPRYLVVTR